MTVSMTGNIDRVEVITSVQRRRRWSAEEKARIVQETYAPGMSVSLVARQHGVAPNQVFTWRRLYAEGALSAVAAGEEVVPRLRIPSFAAPGPRTAAAARQENPRERNSAGGARLGASKKTAVAVTLARAGRHAVKTVADTLGIARSNLAVQARCERSRRLARSSATPRGGACRRDKGADRRSSDLRLSAHPCAAPASAPRTGRYGGEGQAGLPGHEGDGLLLDRHTGSGEERRHDGRIAVDRPDTRWC